jgi:predicted PurR-regulated permease PerM
MSDAVFLKRWIIIILTILLLLGIWHLRWIGAFGFAAAVTATGISVPARWLQRHYVPRGIAVALSTAVLGLLLILAVLWIVPTVINEFVQVIRQLPTMLQRSLDAYEYARAHYVIAKSILPPIDFSSAEQLEQLLNLQRQNIAASLGRMIRPSFITISVGLGIFGSLIANILLFLFLVGFFLADPMSYIKASLYLVPIRYQKRVLEIWDELYHMLTNWVWAQLLSVSITAFLVWIILGVWLHVPHSTVIAVLAGIATFVPIVGTFLPLIPILLFAITTAPNLLAWAIPAYLAIQLV